MRLKTFLLSAFIFALTIPVQTSRAQTLLPPGSPDPTFGTNGRVFTQNQISDSVHPGDMVLQPDGKIVVLTTTAQFRSGFHYYFVLTRYNADGTLDGDFGVGGIVFLRIETGPMENASAKSLSLQPDGKILIGGTIGYDFGMLRVNPNGDLDYSFGENGLVRTEFAGFEEESEDQLMDLIVRPDGKILAYGTSDFQSAINPCTSVNPCHWWVFTKRLAIAQYNSDGSLDTTFGVNGLQKSRFTNSQDYPLKIFLQPDGKLLLAGRFDWLVNTGGNMELRGFVGVVRYNSDGTVDPNFGKNGIRAVQDPSDFYTPLPDGKILGVTFCGSSNCGWSNQNMRIIRYNSDLTRDQSFSEVRHYLMTGSIVGVNLQANGKILCTTYTYPSGNVPYNPKSTLYRFNSDGSADLSFGTNAAVVFDLDGSDTIGSYPHKTIIQPDGKILLGSVYGPASGSGPRGIVVARLLNGSSKFGY